MEDQQKDITEYELEENRQAKKRHKELLDAIGKIKLEPNSKDYTSEIQNVNSSISTLLGKIGEIKIPEQKEIKLPEINVTNDNKEVVVAINELKNISDEIIKKQDKIIELLSYKPSNLKIVRNDTTKTINSVDIQYTQLK